MLYELEAVEGLLEKGTWVAKLRYSDKDKCVKRETIPSRIDYNHKNKPGTRGIFKIFELDTGCVYESSEIVSWDKARRAFFVAGVDKVIPLRKKDAIALLQNKKKGAAQ